MNNEDIEIIEEIINRNDIDEICYIIERKEGDTKNFITAIKKLIKSYKELEEMLKNRIKYTDELEKDLFENASNYVVPKSKIRDLMQDIEETLQICKNDETKFFMSGFKNSIEELLEESEEK